MKLSLFKFSQPAGEFYLTSMSAIEALRISRIERREFDVLTLDSKGGVQRESSSRRINEIAKYSDTPDAAFPTPIILAIDSDDYDLQEKPLEITFKKDAAFATVVDGQHRLLGIQQSTEPSAFQLPVVLLLDAT